MSDKSPAATKKDIDTILSAITDLDKKFEERFESVDAQFAAIDQHLATVNQRFAAIDQRLEISEDERLVMAHQPTRLHEWIERDAKRIGVEFAR